MALLLAVLTLSFCVSQRNLESEEALSPVFENNVLRSAESATLIEKLRATKLLNADEVHALLELVGDEGNIDSSLTDAESDSEEFLTRNPYEPQFRQAIEEVSEIQYPLPKDERSYELDVEKGIFTFYGQEPVFRWYSQIGEDKSVCAVGFVDTKRQDYQLRTFADRESALAAGYIVTHAHHCGTCSTLKDLAVYLEKTDLTTPVRSCARNFTRNGVRDCLLEEIGFTRHCAETWAYNVRHTRAHCTGICVEHYGIWRVWTDDLGQANTDEHGKLNPCISCDEHVSGPGFKYAAGRTRRSSGLHSEIQRGTDEIDSVDHSLYFDSVKQQSVGSEQE